MQRPTKAKRPDNIHIVSIHSKTGEPYLRQLEKHKIEQIVLLDAENIERHVLGAVKKGGTQIHNLHIDPYHSFSEEGRQRLARAAQIVYEAALRGKPTAITCARGERRSTRVDYLLLRKQGRRHKTAMELSKAPKEDAEKLRETYRHFNKHLSLWDANNTQ
jgi:hypothetical protein